MPGGREHERGEFFGEMALLGGHSTEQDVIAVNASVLLVLDAAAFEATLGPYMRLLEAHYNCAVLAQVKDWVKGTRWGPRRGPKGPRRAWKIARVIPWRRRVGRRRFVVRARRAGRVGRS